MLMFGAFTHAQMGATFVIETERWSFAEEMLRAPGNAAPDAQTTKGDLNPLTAYAVLAEIPVIFARGLAKASLGDEGALENAGRLQEIRARTTAAEPMIAHAVSASEIQEKQILGRLHASRGDFDEAIRILSEAAAAELAMPPPPGPPPGIKPAHELYGEVLLLADRPAEAMKAFETSLERHRDRGRSLLGLARAAAQLSDRERAAEIYQRFTSQWSASDPDSPELREAREFAPGTEDR
jgi:tetratricopeptide (TPR) repeat protein